MINFITKELFPARIYKWIYISIATFAVTMFMLLILLRFYDYNDLIINFLTFVALAGTVYKLLLSRDNIFLSKKNTDLINKNREQDIIIIKLQHDLSDLKHELKQKNIIKSETKQCTDTINTVLDKMELLKQLKKLN